jgi:hypothetical protein
VAVGTTDGVRLGVGVAVGFVDAGEGGVPMPTLQLYKKNISNADIINNCIFINIDQMIKLCRK